MQNFNSEQGDSLSAVEAQEVLKAWTNRQQAQGVDPSVNSVTSLAAGLGVSEADVRRMLEDIRVQQRSQQIAAGILQQEQKHRKRLDVTAAIGAGAALCVLALIVAAIVLFGHRSRPPRAFIPIPPIPATTNVISETEPDGTTTVIDQNGIHIVHPNGKTVQINDPQAISKLASKLGEIKAREAAEQMKSQGGKLTEEQKKELTDLSKQEADIKKAMKEMTQGLDTSSDTPTPPPATPANGR